jgi:hypothetical protein
MSGYLVWALALAAIAIWAQIVVGLVARFFWPQVPIRVRDGDVPSSDGQPPHPTQPRPGGIDEDEEFEVATWEPEWDDPDFLKLRDQPSKS